MARLRQTASQRATESKQLSENCACASPVAAANGRAWNVAPVELAPHDAITGGQFFAESFLENELAQPLRTILDSNKLESVKTLQKCEAALGGYLTV